MKLIKYIIGISFFIGLLSCEREFIRGGDGNELSFSVDTLSFDTLFSTIGSVTKNFKIYNKSKTDLIIDEIKLSGGDNSFYRININGVSSNSLERVKLRAKDSMFIFVELTIESKGEDLPFIVADSVLFSNGDVNQKVILYSYGQDAVILKNEQIKTSTFTSNRPYLIYGDLIVNSNEKLVVEAGARLYFHKDARLIVNGSIEVKGSLENPVVLQGDRLDSFFDDLPGQWNGVELKRGSFENAFSYTTIKNCMNGLQVDSIGIDNDEFVALSNTKIIHASEIGLRAVASNIKASNCLFADCGLNTVALILGGEHQFNHCTMANYFAYNDKLNGPALYISDYVIDAEDIEVQKEFLKAEFLNSIIYGNNYKELIIDLYSESIDNSDVLLSSAFGFNHCLLRADADMVETNPERFIEVILNEDPSFVDYRSFNFALDTLSAAKDVGSVLYSEMNRFDYNGVDRLMDRKSDLGLFERVENEK